MQWQWKLNQILPTVHDAGLKHVSFSYCVEMAGPPVIWYKKIIWASHIAGLYLNKATLLVSLMGRVIGFRNPFFDCT